MGAWDRVTEFAVTLRELVSGLLSFPRLVPAAAAAVLVVKVVCLGVYQHLTTPITIQLHLIAKGAEDLLTRDPAEEKEILVPRGECSAPATGFI